jgi:hypothetical protein
VYEVAVDQVAYGQCGFRQRGAISDGCGFQGVERRVQLVVLATELVETGGGVRGEGHDQRPQDVVLGLVVVMECGHQEVTQLRQGRRIAARSGGCLGE